MDERKTSQEINTIYYMVQALIFHVLIYQESLRPVWATSNKLNQVPVLDASDQPYLCKKLIFSLLGFIKR